jgi:hypothetical protein
VYPNLAEELSCWDIGRSVSHAQVELFFNELSFSSCKPLQRAIRRFLTYQAINHWTYYDHLLGHRHR